MRARGHKLTEERRAAILNNLRTGLSVKSAAERTGVSYQTYADWLRRGRGEHPRLRQTQFWADFAAEVDRVLAEAEAQAIRKVHQAADTDWRAAAWFLERRFRERWGRQTEQPVAAGGEVKVVFVDTLSEELAERERRQGGSIQ